MEDLSATASATFNLTTGKKNTTSKIVSTTSHFAFDLDLAVEDMTDAQKLSVSNAVAQGVHEGFCAPLVPSLFADLEQCLSGGEGKEGAVAELDTVQELSDFIKDVVKQWA